MTCAQPLQADLGLAWGSVGQWTAWWSQRRTHHCRDRLSMSLFLTKCKIFLKYFQIICTCSYYTIALNFVFFKISDSVNKLVSLWVKISGSRRVRLHTETSRSSICSHMHKHTRTHAHTHTHIHKVTNRHVINNCQIQPFWYVALGGKIVIYVVILLHRLTQAQNQISSTVLAVFNVSRNVWIVRGNDSTIGTPLPLASVRSTLLL